MTLKTSQVVTPSGMSQGKFQAGYLDACATGRRGGFRTAQAGGPWLAGPAVGLLEGAVVLPGWCRRCARCPAVSLSRCVHTWVGRLFVRVLVHTAVLRIILYKFYCLGLNPFCSKASFCLHCGCVQSDLYGCASCCTCKYV